MIAATATPHPAEPHAPMPTADILWELIVAFLAPMFTTASCGDYGFARLAAMETLAAYGARTQAELLNIALIIGCSLTALDSLCLSMQDDLTLPMKLRLRAGANALNRSAQQNQRTLDKRQQLDQPPPASYEADAATEAEIEVSIEQARDMARAAKPGPVPASREQHDRMMWASAMTTVADELTRDLAAVAPAERSSARMWADALGTSARAIVRENTGPTKTPPADPSAKS